MKYKLWVRNSETGSEGAWLMNTPDLDHARNFESAGSFMLAEAIKAIRYISEAEDSSVFQLMPVGVSVPQR